MTLTECPSYTPPITISSFPYYYSGSGFSYYYAIDNSVDYNNTDLKVTLTDAGSPNENRSLFGVRPYY